MAHQAHLGHEPVGILIDMARSGSPPTHPYLDGPHPRAFAHRGWHIDDLAGMENSLSAYRRAIAEGYTYLETDIRVTADGVVVMHHDSTLDRTTDGSGPVVTQPWSAVRRARIAGREPICRLEDVLEELPTARINVDVKADAATLPLLHTLHRTNTWHRVCVASFSDRRLAALRQQAGERLLTGVGPRSALELRVRSWAPWLPGRPWIRGLLAQLPRFQGRLRVIDDALVRYARRNDIEVHAWIIDTEAEMVELLDLGVDGLITDRPDVLRRVLAARGCWA